MAGSQTRGTRRSQAERREETQRRLFQAALESLAEGGYAAMTLSGVVKRAGVSPGALWRYCKSKADLAHAAVQWATREGWATGRSELEREGTDDVESLSDLLLVEPSGMLARAGLELLRAAASDEQLRRVVAESSWEHWLDWSEAFREALGGEIDERTAAMTRVLSLAATALQVFFRDEEIATVLRSDIQLLTRETLPSREPKPC